MKQFFGNFTWREFFCFYRVLCLLQKRFTKILAINLVLECEQFQGFNSIEILSDGKKINVYTNIGSDSAVVNLAIQIKRCLNYTYNFEVIRYDMACIIIDEIQPHHSPPPWSGNAILNFFQRQRRIHTLFCNNFLKFQYICCKPNGNNNHNNNNNNNTH